MQESDYTAANTKISEIIIGDRFRKKYLNVDQLAESIASIGLLSPVIITPENKLVAGGRRIEAYKLLGRDEIPARTVPVESLLDAEIDENNSRESFSVSEKVAIADTLTEKIGERRGKKPQDVDSSKDVNPDACPDFGLETRDFVSKRAGLGSSRIYRQAKLVLEKAIPEVVEAMDCNAISVNLASRIAQTPKKKQLTMLNEARDPETDASELDEFNKARRKAKRKAKAHVPTGPQAEPIYNVIRVSPDWCNEIEDDICELPVADYISSTGIVCIECTNDRIASAMRALEAWGFTYQALVTIHNAKAKAASYFAYINQMTYHIIIGQIDPEICGARLTQIPAVYNRQKPIDSLAEIVDEMCPDKKDTRLDMSATEARSGWKVWKIDYASKKD